MIALTGNALAILRELTCQRYGRGTLRIAYDTAAGHLVLTLPQHSADGDLVVEKGGARLFLDPRAADLLDHMALDIVVFPDGVTEFFVVERLSD